MFTQHALVHTCWRVSPQSQVRNKAHTVSAFRHLRGDVRIRVELESPRSSRQHVSEVYILRCSCQLLLGNLGVDGCLGHYSIAVTMLTLFQVRSLKFL